MKFLIDTNVFIPLEPYVGREPDLWTQNAIAFSRVATGTGQQLFVHPAARSDIERIRDADLKATRSIQFEKYAELPSPPGGTRATENILGKCSEGTNGWVDDQLLIALYADAIDCLVSEDDGVHRKARRLGVSDRTLRLLDAVELLNRLITRHAEPAPIVVSAKVHALDREDPIFASLRSDYNDFNDWLARAARAHRDAWYVAAADGSYAAIAIVKFSETRSPGKHLKLCCFKVSDAAQGKKYSELMLRQVFEHCYANDVAGCYVTVFPKYQALIALLEHFGFAKEGTTERGEGVYAKQMVPHGLGLDPLAFNVAFGPRHVLRDVPTHIVPIVPKYDAMLFPEAQRQLSLVPQDQPFGNAMLKAYLCRAGTRKIRPGDVLLFYRSEDAQAVRHVGVVEATIVATDANLVARFVGLRTVYTLREIEDLCAKGEVLVIKFRYAWSIDGITLETLLRCRVLNGAPQSIQQVGDDSRDLIWNLIDASGR